MDLPVPSILFTEEEVKKAYQEKGKEPDPIGDWSDWLVSGLNTALDPVHHFVDDVEKMIQQTQQTKLIQETAL